MKKIFNLIINTINIILVLMLTLNFIDYKKEVDTTFVFKNNFKLNSNFFVYSNDKVEVKEEPLEDNNIEESIVKEEVNQPIIPLEPPKVEIPKPVVPPFNILETFMGTISGYGPDCYGCTSNKTASGYYVGNKNIFYNDTSYGNIRIVAADNKYPFGTIVKIKGYEDDITAIVLDRGSSIGIGKRIQFDILFASESDASVIGIRNNITFEILRLGY